MERRRPPETTPNLTYSRTKTYADLQERRFSNWSALNLKGVKQLGVRPAMPALRLSSAWPHSTA